MSTLPTVCLSIRQPWATSIVHFGKRIENRSWATKFRGRFLIHASKGYTLEEYADWRDFVNRRIPIVDSETWPQMTFRDLPRGGIVGVATLVDCVTKHASPWFVGKYGFVLEDVQPLPFVACKGALGFFALPQGAEVKAA